tara:strand:+ start:92 stop:292 length:201 start_codon:yes stop_codon:yes gene_type:complete
MPRQISIKRLRRGNKDKNALYALSESGKVYRYHRPVTDKYIEDTMIPVLTERRSITLKHWTKVKEI